MAYRWRFFRAGGFDQVRLDRGSDLVHLDQLDQKLWVALSCPTRGLEFDTKTLDLIDSDGDGRIRVPEMLNATRWITGLLKNPDELIRRPTVLPLEAINEENPEGRQLLASARQILGNLGKKDASQITLEDTADTAKIFAQTLFNGDGIIPVDAAEDAATKALIQDIITTCGAELDRSGKPGISQSKVDTFFAEAQAFSDWWKQAEADRAKVLPLGDATAGAVAALRAVRSKVDDYFSRVRLAAYDARAGAVLNPSEATYLALAAKPFSANAQEMAELPLARIEAGRAVPLRDGLNPAWAEPMAALVSQVIKPILGDKTVLTQDEWALVNAKLSAFEAWTSSKAGAKVEGLGLARAREILSGKSKDGVTALLAKDKALEPEANAIVSVDKAIHYYRDLAALLCNFVSFRDFFGAGTQAIFQAGTLYLDNRSCDLCVRVLDMGKQGTLAGLSRCYLAYCDCTRKGSADKLTIAAAFTDGDSDFLMAGRNGVFYDRQGRDWDATIVKVVENPISLRQAFWAPYKRVVRMVEEQIEKFAAAKDKALTDQAALNLTTATQSAQAAKPPAAATPAFDVAKFAGIFAAIGLALGALGTAFAALLNGFLGLPAWQMPLAVVGVMLLISGPSMLLAFMKLRQRNLGPILDANGWAVNARVKINVPFGATLTHIARLPAGSERSFEDPFAEKPNPWPKLLLMAAILAIAGYVLNQRGKLHQWFGVGKKPPVHAVAGTNAPAASGLETNAPPKP